MERLVHRANGELIGSKIYVALVTEIAPDIRIDLGGGGIGDTYLLGVADTRETALYRTREHAEREFKMHEQNEEVTYEEISNYIDTYYEYRVEERALEA